jgi:hypothetical protein
MVNALKLGHGVISLNAMLRFSLLPYVTRLSQPLRGRLR